jgi:uncharacterized protein YkwD
MQQQMLGHINKERARFDLAPLVLNKQLSAGAYYKSKDMAVNRYFEHLSPTYGSAFAVMKNMGITYRCAAENIAINRSVKAAHQAFMKSPGHRSNILDPQYFKVGLGFYRRGSSLYVTQWFTD